MSKPHKPLTYEASGVDYSKIDPFKHSALELALSTAPNASYHGFTEMTGSRGRSAYVTDIGPLMLAGVLEGLGTKNMVADKVDQTASESHYGAIAQCNMATNVNDLSTCGAKAAVYWAHVAAGESQWFEDAKRARAYNIGIAAVCNELKIVWAGGESPVLKGIIAPGQAELSGFLLGFISPKERYISGGRLEKGDRIVMVASSGMHANGFTAMRQLADEELPEGYETKLSDGTTFGEALLVPTYLYANLTQSLLDHGVDLHGVENITGHGWGKLMRSPEPYTYRIDKLPPASALFDFVRDQTGLDDLQMHSTYNMGAGYALFMPAGDVEKAIAIAASQRLPVGGLQAWDAGGVEEGPKKVVIEPLGGIEIEPSH